MGSHLDAVVKACDKALEEAAKLEKQWKAAKPGPEKDKLKKMAEGAKKIGIAFYAQVDAAKLKDEKDMLATFKNMGL